MIVSIAIIAIIASIYFTQGKDGESSQYEKGQEGVEQAQEIYNNSVDYSKEVNEVLEIQNTLNGQ